MERAPGELAVADVAAARRPEAADFADRIRREVIVQHEVLIGEPRQPVDHLLAIAGAERGGGDRLGLATGEQRRSVCARQEVDRRLDRAHRLGVAAVDTDAFLQDLAADDLGLDLLHQLQRAEIFGRVGVLQILERLARLGAGGGDRGLALLLVGQLVGGGHVGADQVLELRLVARQVGTLGQLPGLLGGLLGELDDRLDHLLARLVREHHRAEHDVLGQLLGLRFDHHHRIVGRGDHQVELAGGDFAVRRVELILAVLVADARRADRAHEGHAGQGHRGRRSDHREQVGLVLAVVAHHLRDAVDLVVEPFGEQRPKRPVDQAADQRLTLGGATLALEEAAGDAAARGELLLVMDSEREEVLPFLDGLGGSHRAEHDRLAERREHRAVGLAGNAARLQRQRLAAPLDFHFLGIEHRISFTPAALCGWGLCCGQSRPAAVWSASWLRAGLPNCRRSGYEKGAPRAPFGLLAETQLLDQREIAVAVLVAEIVEQRAPLVDHHQQPAARMVVLLVGLEMRGQVLDPLGQHRDLDLGRPGVAVLAGVLLDEFGLALCGNRHAFVLDIGLQVEAAHDGDVPVANLDQRHGRLVEHREGQAVGGGNPGQRAPLTERPCLVGSKG